MDTIQISKRNVKMVAHQGLSGLERGNTCPAFVAAGNRSYYGIETDLRKTADGRFVITHNETTDESSGGRWSLCVAESTYEQLKEVVLSDLDGSAHRQDIRIPLLIDYIKICKHYEKRCVLELKDAFTEADIKNIIEEIKTVGYLDHVIFIAFSLEYCRILRRLLPENKIQWLLGGAVTEENFQTLVNEKLDLDLTYQHVTESLVTRLHEHGIEVNCWTCDDPAEAERLVAMGVDMITSNILE